MDLCRCAGKRNVRFINNFNRAPLVDGGYTMFDILVCDDCGLMDGFPRENLEIALNKGTHETILSIERAAKKEGLIQ